MLKKFSVNPILMEDIEATITNSRSILNQFKNKIILITGITGLVTRILTLTLLVADEQLNLNLKIIGVARNLDKVKAQYANLVENDNFEILVQDIRDEITTQRSVDFIFHGAAVTDSKSLRDFPLEAFDTQVKGTENILEFATKTKATVVYLSSMEIYGQPFVDGKATEKDLGYVDPLITRSGYPEAKRACEFLCHAYMVERKLKVVSARLAQTFGPGVSNTDNRVFAQFIRSAIAKEDIVLHTDGSSMGNYCYLPDVIKALLLLAVEGKPGEAYNIVNEVTNVSIKQMATLVATEFGNGKVIIDIPNEDMGYAPKVNLHLSGEKLRRLGWHSDFDLKQMFTRTIESFQAEG